MHQRVQVFPEKVLLIDEDEEFAKSLSLALEEIFHCQVETAADPYVAADLLIHFSFGLVVCDWQLPPFRGTEALGWIEPAGSGVKGRRPIPLIIATSFDRDEPAFKAELGGRFEFLGVVSKEQPVEGIQNQIRILYGNCPLKATG